MHEEVWEELTNPNYLVFSILESYWNAVLVRCVYLHTELAFTNMNLISSTLWWNDLILEPRAETDIIILQIHIQRTISSIASHCREKGQELFATASSYTALEFYVNKVTSPGKLSSALQHCAQFSYPLLSNIRTFLLFVLEFCLLTFYECDNTP